MFYQGVLLGLTLSFLVGPLLFSIVEAGLERGFKGGMAVATGIWLSDVLFVALMIKGLSVLESMVAHPRFKLYAGLLGGIILVLFGLGSLIRHKKSNFPTQNTLPRSYKGYFLRGFLLNSINPFTVIFWIGIAGGVIAPGNWTMPQTLVFFSGMFGTLALMDMAKAFGAKKLRQWLTPTHISQLQRGIGLLLVVFGFVLVVRSM
jgi:threonine/homoserine/homoserine lactone efflux protein